MALEARPGPPNHPPVGPPGGRGPPRSAYVTPAPGRSGPRVSHMISHRQTGDTLAGPASLAGLPRQGSIPGSISSVGHSCASFRLGCDVLLMTALLGLLSGASPCTSCTDLLPQIFTLSPLSIARGGSCRLVLRWWVMRHETHSCTRVRPQAPLHAVGVPWGSHVSPPCEMSSFSLNSLHWCRLCPMAMLRGEGREGREAGQLRLLPRPPELHRQQASHLTLRADAAQGA